MSYSAISAIHRIYTHAAQEDLTFQDLPSIRPLTEIEIAGALAFLAARPVHTVIIDGLLRQHGVDSLLNRGNFYISRGENRAIQGIALIGHHVLFETSNEGAIREFARLARQTSGVHLIMGESEKISRFWTLYTGGNQIPHSPGRELLLEQRWPVEALQDIADLRLATLEDLELVSAAHAAVAFEERGPGIAYGDPIGFKIRCAHRIEQGRVWVWIKDGRLIFKVDIVSNTPYVTYLEGAYVAPCERGRGYGLRCFSKLSRLILERTASICLFVNERNDLARSFYKRAGFKLRSRYDRIVIEQV